MAQGFTLLEILLVVGIIGVLIILTLPVGLDLYKNQQLEVNSRTILQTLRRAQLKAMSIESDANYGVYLSDESFILFKGSSYFGRDSQYDQVFDLPQAITISGMQEVVFTKLTGKPKSIGFININSDGKRRVININRMGRMNLQ